MSFWTFLQQNWSEMLTLVREHLILVLISTSIAVVIGIPTGILLTRNQALRPARPPEPQVQLARPPGRAARQPLAPLPVRPAGCSSGAPSGA